MALICIVCGGDRFGSVYRGPIRSGRFGSLSTSDFEVVRCAGCGIDGLQPSPLAAADYETGAYRAAVDGESEATAYYANHDAELASRLALVGSHILRGKVVADIGCGAGTFLDLVKGLAARTIGIEPQTDFGILLTEKGHQSYTYPADAAAAEPNAMDLAFSFQVLEHVSDPLAFLRDIAACLKPGGELHLTTPNRDDLLMKVGGERYHRFFYRVAHAWYFDRLALTETARRAGLKVVAMSTPHRYDLSNFAIWLRDGRPAGLGGINELTGPANGAFREQIAAAGMGDLLYAVLARISL